MSKPVPVKLNNQFLITSIYQPSYLSINQSMSKPSFWKIEYSIRYKIIQSDFISVNQSMSKPSFCYIELSIPYYTNQSVFISVNQSINQSMSKSSFS